MISTFEARRPCRIGVQTRWPGEPVPEAHLWRLSEGLVRNGRLRQVEMAERDFAEAVERFCPGDAKAIFALVGVTEFEVPDDPIEPDEPDEPEPEPAPRKRTRSRKVLVTPPEPLDP